MGSNNRVPLPEPAVLPDLRQPADLVRQAVCLYRWETAPTASEKAWTEEKVNCAYLSAFPLETGAGKDVFT